MVLCLLDKSHSAHPRRSGLLGRSLRSMIHHIMGGLPHLDHLLPCPDHLLPRQELQKQKQGGIREPQESLRDSGKLFPFFKLTRIGCRTSWLTVVIASCSSHSTVVTHEHSCSALLSTCRQLTGGDGKQGEFSRRSPAIPGPTVLENSRVGTASPEAVNRHHAPPCHDAVLQHHHLAEVCPIHLDVVGA
jgi:hypothetical protein